MSGTREKAKESAIAAARAGGEELRTRFAQPRTIKQKANFTDLVTDADTAAEAKVLEVIQAAHPFDAILAEESGAHRSEGPGRWLIDPLDGTTNYAHHVPHFAVSIGYEERGELVLGVVYDPMRDELFVGEKGKGATLNDAPIHVSQTQSLNAAMLATGFPYWLQERPQPLLDLFSAFIKEVQTLRRFGSAALDLAWVAAGRYDGFFELGLKSWDVAAGSVLVEAAGGRVSGTDGLPLVVDAGHILAANGLLHARLLQVARGVTAVP